MGDCYEVNGNFVLDHLIRSPQQMDRLILVHAEVDGQGPLEGRRLGHCWVENPDTGFAFDFSNGRNIVLPIARYRALAQTITKERRYTAAEVRARVLKEEHWGPWEESEESEDSRFAWGPGDLEVEE